FRAGAFHQSVRQGHSFFRIDELRDGWVFNKTGRFQARINQLGQLAIFVAVGLAGVFVINFKTGENGLGLLAHFPDHLLRGKSK
ncbi:hypothetical protein AK79_24210, partial [Salmonella enterica subsp. enterica serovar Bareilly str. CFSAN001089]